MDLDPERKDRRMTLAGLAFCLAALGLEGWVLRSWYRGIGRPFFAGLTSQRIQAAVFAGTGLALALTAYVRTFRRGRPGLLAQATVVLSALSTGVALLLLGLL